MKVPEFISRLNPLKRGVDTPQVSEQEATARRLEAIKRVRKTTAGQPVNFVDIEYPEKQVEPSAKTSIKLDKFDPQQKAAVEDLLRKRKMLVHYTIAPDSTGPSRARDAKEIAKIDAKLAELGINPAEISSDEKAA